MMLFFNWTRLERIRVVGLDLDSCCWAGLPALDCRAGDRTAAGLVCRLWGVVLLYKNKKEGGSARASPVAAPIPKSVPR